MGDQRRDDILSATTDRRTWRQAAVTVAILGALSVLAFGHLLFRPARARILDADERTLVRLREAGSDLRKPHEFEFFLGFPTKADAEEAAARLRASGFPVHVDSGNPAREWMCVATKTAVPELTELRRIRGEFSQLAASLQGEYQGWGVDIVK